MIRNYLLTLGLAVGLLAGLGQSTASGAIIIDSLDNAQTHVSTIEPLDWSGKAVNFTLAAGDDYTLTSVVLDLSSADGSDDLLVELWSDDGTASPIGSLLETLTDPAALANGLNTFTSSGTTLLASTTYWIVVRGEQGFVQWIGSTDQTVDTDTAATHTARLYPANVDAPTPGTWNGSSGVLNRVQVNATIVPEPASMALLAAGGLLMTVRGRRA